MVNLGNGYYETIDSFILTIVLGLLLLAGIALVWSLKKEIKQHEAQKKEFYDPSEDEIKTYEKAKIIKKDTYIHNEGSDRYFPHHSIIYLVELETKEGECLSFKVPQEMFEAIKEGDIGTVTIKNGDFYAFELG